MADLLANQKQVNINVIKGQLLTGKVLTILPQEIILDLGTKAEGVLRKQDMSDSQSEAIKEGDSVEVVVVRVENESGQVLLNLASSNRSLTNPKFNKFIDAKDSTFNGRGVELNKGGLVVEVGAIRGFIPFSQLSVKFAATPEDLIGKDLTLKVIEVDPAQNRLIFAQKTVLSPEQKVALAEVKIGDKLTGQVTSVAIFGLMLSLDKALDGFIHISELSWEKTEDPNTLYKVGDTLEAQVLSVDNDAGKVNLSLKMLQVDPFTAAMEKYQPDDVVKAKIKEVTAQGVIVGITDKLDALMPSDVLEAGVQYTVGEEITVLIDKVDKDRRKITVSPMLSTTSGLIYK